MNRDDDVRFDGSPFDVQVDAPDVLETRITWV